MPGLFDNQHKLLKSNFPAHMITNLVCSIKNAPGRPVRGVMYWMEGVLYQRVCEWTTKITTMHYINTRQCVYYKPIHLSITYTTFLPGLQGSWTQSLLTSDERQGTPWTGPIQRQATIPTCVQFRVAS